MSEKQVEIDVDIPDDVFLALAKMAHEKDITFNQMCVIAIQEMIDHYEQKESQKD